MVVVVVMVMVMVMGVGMGMVVSMGVAVIGAIVAGQARQRSLICVHA
jgi:hypothetical protein